MKAKKLIKKYELSLRGENHVSVPSSKQEEAEKNIDEIKSKKEEILRILKERKKKEEQKRKKEEQRREKEYQKLIEKLPEAEVETKNNDKKAKKILEKRNFDFFEGEESDGLNLNIKAENERLEKKAQKYCEHDLKTEITKTYTADSRLKVVREITCAKCSLHKKDSVEQKVENVRAK